MLDVKPIDYARSTGMPRRNARWIMVFALVAGISIALARPGRMPGPAVRATQLTDRVRADFDTIETAILCFEADTGELPTERDGLARLCRPTWRGPCLKRVPRDPWGQAYVYHKRSDANGASYSVLCLGEDGREGTADDIRPSRSCATGLLAPVESRQLQNAQALRLPCKVFDAVLNENPCCSTWGLLLLNERVNNLTEAL